MAEIDDWGGVRRLFRSAFTSSLHYAIASVDAQGAPHLTPIGSLILDRPGHGFYFERFTTRLPRHLGKDARVCVLAVDSGRWFWLRSLIAGRFARPPAMRLYGVVGEARAATAREKALWLRRVRPLRFTRGHALLWRDMETVREISFERAEPVHLGAMTAGL